jgi:mersacidin/lichenicidin family type 2 lantibiotic
MTTLETVKAWKDEEYRDTLTEAQRQKLPAHPAGVIELEPAQPGGEGPFGPVNGSTQRARCTWGIFCTSAPKACK